MSRCDFVGQAIATETGRIMDDFTVKKEPGLSPDTIFFKLFFNDLAADLKKDHQLLASLNNATLVVAPNTEDNVPRLSQIFDAYAKILRSPNFAQENGITDPTAAAKFIYSAFLPLFQHFDNNTVAASLNPSIDPNVLKGPTSMNQTMEASNTTANTTSAFEFPPPNVSRQGPSAPKP
ncbi:g10560 [Coccomyxa elongata]